MLLERKTWYISIILSLGKRKLYFNWICHIHSRSRTVEVYVEHPEWTPWSRRFSLCWDKTQLFYYLLQLWTLFCRNYFEICFSIGLLLTSTKSSFMSNNISNNSSIYFSFRLSSYRLDIYDAFPGSALRHTSIKLRNVLLNEKWRYVRSRKNASTSLNGSVWSQIYTTYRWANNPTCQSSATSAVFISRG